MMQVQCPHCGRKLTVPDGQAGRAGQCPGCKNRITIPPAVAPPSTAISEDLLVAPPSPADLARARASEQGQSESPTAPSDALDRRLLDLPPAGSGDAKLSDEEVLAKLKGKPAPEYTGTRPLPWPIDILLYPANTPGLMNLAIIVGIPLLLTILQHVVFLPFLGLFFFLAELGLAIYAAWYWAECTWDSAQGGTRAPQMLDAAGYGDKWSRVFYLLPVYLVFVLPAVLYSRHVGRRDAILWMLVAWGVVFFPMGLLAMVMQDGLYVLNPLFLLGSIRRTLAPYVGLLLAMAALGTLFRLVFGLLAQSAWLAGPVLLASGYLSLIAAHLLGRFYWHYRERLDWGI